MQINKVTVILNDTFLIWIPVNYETEELSVSQEALNNVVDAYIDYLVSEDIDVVEALNDITELFVWTCEAGIVYGFYNGGTCVYEDYDYEVGDVNGNA